MELWSTNEGTPLKATWKARLGTTSWLSNTFVQVSEVPANCASPPTQPQQLRIDLACSCKHHCHHHLEVPLLVWPKCPLEAAAQTCLEWSWEGAEVVLSSWSNGLPRVSGANAALFCTRATLLCTSARGCWSTCTKPAFARYPNHFGRIWGFGPLAAPVVGTRVLVSISKIMLCRPTLLQILFLRPGSAHVNLIDYLEKSLHWFRWVLLLIKSGSKKRRFLERFFCKSVCLSRLWYFWSSWAWHSTLQKPLLNPFWWKPPFSWVFFLIKDMWVCQKHSSENSSGHFLARGPSALLQTASEIASIAGKRGFLEITLSTACRRLVFGKQEAYGPRECTKNTLCLPLSLGPHDHQPQLALQQTQVDL